MVKAVVTQQQQFRARVSTQNQTTVQSVGLSPGQFSIEQLANVDASALENGAVLVYKSNTSNWTATTTLEEQNLEGGHY